MLAKIEQLLQEIEGLHAANGTYIHIEGSF